MVQLSQKKKKLTIKSTEGHGKLDGKHEGEEIIDYLLCRFNYPHFPMKETTFIPGLSKDLLEERHCKD